MLDRHRQLIQQSVAGDRDALQQLLFEQFEAVESFLRPRVPRELRGEISVDDILQETLIQAFRDIRTFDPAAADSFSAWLRVIASHRLQDAMRHARRIKRGGHRRQIHGPGESASTGATRITEWLAAHQDTPSEQVAKGEAIRAVQVGIAGLPTAQREALQLVCVQQQSIDEAATNLQLTEGAVRGLVYRAKLALRDALRRSSLWFRKS